MMLGGHRSDDVSRAKTRRNEDKRLKVQAHQSHYAERDELMTPREAQFEVRRELISVQEERKHFKMPKFESRPRVNPLTRDGLKRALS